MTLPQDYRPLGRTEIHEVVHCERERWLRWTWSDFQDFRTQGQPDIVFRYDVMSGTIELYVECYIELISPDELQTSLKIQEPDGTCSYTCWVIPENGPVEIGEDEINEPSSSTRPQSPRELRSVETAQFEDVLQSEIARWRRRRREILELLPTEGLSYVLISGGRRFTVDLNVIDRNPVSYRLELTVWLGPGCLIGIFPWRRFLLRQAREFEVRFEDTQPAD